MSTLQKLQLKAANISISFIDFIKMGKPAVYCTFCDNLVQQVITYLDINRG